MRINQIDQPRAAQFNTMFTAPETQTDQTNNKHLARRIDFLRPPPPSPQHINPRGASASALPTNPSLPPPASDGLTLPPPPPSEGTPRETSPCPRSPPPRSNSGHPGHTQLRLTHTLEGSISTSHPLYIDLIQQLLHLQIQ